MSICLAVVFSNRFCCIVGYCFATGCNFQISFCITSVIYCNHSYILFTFFKFCSCLLQSHFICLVIQTKHWVKACTMDNLCSIFFTCNFPMFQRSTVKSCIYKVSSFTPFKLFICWVLSFCLIENIRCSSCCFNCNLTIRYSCICYFFLTIFCKFVNLSIRPICR